MILEIPRIEARLEIEEKIGEGQHREVFRSGQFAVKVLKPYRVKKQWFRTVRLPLQNYIWNRYGIEDFNQLEYENYSRLAESIPAAMRDFFNPVHWAGQCEGQNISVCDLVLNDDGNAAQPLARFGVMLDDKFWTALNEIEALLLDCKLYFTGMNGDNLLVRRKNGIYQPVFVDYKWLGRGAYPCQFWLRWETGLRRKLRGKFQRLRDAYQPRA